MKPAASRFSSPVALARLFFVLLTTFMSTLLAMDIQQNPRIFSLVGCLAAILVVLVEYASNALSSRKIVMAALGWFLGVVFAQMFYPSFAWMAGMLGQFIENYLVRRTMESFDQPRVARGISIETARFVSHMMFGYFGLVLALRHADWLRLANLKLYLANPTDRPKTLDASAIIDGRIAGLTGMGLLSGQVLVPGFVLREIQGLADSSEENRRARGRRGLEVLDQLRTRCPSLDIIETDYEGLAGMDQKLVRLCRELNADIVTTDASLQKIAQLHQITVINLNELAEAMRPSVYVGETLRIKIIKPGKEPDQGIGYLEDGTMVVAEGGGRHVGRDCDVTISSILQNPTGRMVFAKRAAD